MVGCDRSIPFHMVSLLSQTSQIKINICLFYATPSILYSRVNT